MSYREYAEQPRRRTSRALVRLTVLVWLLVFSCVGLRAFAIPAINGFFYQQVNRVAEAVNPQQVVPLPSGISSEEEARERIEQLVLPGLPTIPIGSFTINNQQATAYMAGQIGQYGVDRFDVQFEPGQVVATVGQGPLTGTLRANARAENGRVVLENERIDGLLGRVLDPVPLVNALENRLNTEIDRQGRNVQSVDAQQGQATIVFE
jgi:hypothetical protein